MMNMKGIYFLNMKKLWSPFSPGKYTHPDFADTNIMNNQLGGLILQENKLKS